MGRGIEPRLELDVIIGRGYFSQNFVLAGEGVVPEQANEVEENKAEIREDFVKRITFIYPFTAYFIERLNKDYWVYVWRSGARFKGA